MTPRKLLAALALSSALAWTSPAFTAESAQSFVQKAAIGGLFEVQSSELAAEKSTNAEVKDFAQMMINDHTRANQELQNIAQQQGLTVPTELDDEHAQKMATLREANAQFSARYMEMQEEAHESAVDLFEDYAEDGDNAALKDFANATLPTLKRHLESAKSVSQQVGQLQ